MTAQATGRLRGLVIPPTTDILARVHRHGHAHGDLALPRGRRRPRPQPPSGRGRRQEPHPEDPPRRPSARVIVLAVVVVVIGAVADGVLVLWPGDCRPSSRTAQTRLVAGRDPGAWRGPRNHRL